VIAAMVFFHQQSVLFRQAERAAPGGKSLALMGW
jgi:hypothetical protein